MATLIGGLTMSVDGFVARHDGGVEPLFDWYEAGEVAVATDRPDMTWHLDPASAGLVRELVAGVRALLIGTRFFVQMDGWGGHHPFGAGLPIVVPCRAVPDGWPREDRPDARFVVGDLAAAVEEVRSLAGDGIVGVGGARTIQRCLEAGLLDELHVSLAPVLLGDGIPFFDAVAGAPVLLPDPEVIPGARVIHLRYRLR